MQAWVLLAIGIANIVFGIKRRAKNLPMTKEYRENIEKKYIINDEAGLRDFEEFVVIFLGLIIVLTSIGMIASDYFEIAESIQISVFLVLASIMVYSYRTIRATFIEKRKKK